MREKGAQLIIILSEFLHFHIRWLFIVSFHSVDQFIDVLLSTYELQPYLFLLTFTGILACLDGYMNIAMEQTEEYVNGQLKNKYGDAFIRGNNGNVLMIVDIYYCCFVSKCGNNEMSLALMQCYTLVHQRGL